MLLNLMSTLSSILEMKRRWIGTEGFVEGGDWWTSDEEEREQCCS